MQNASYRSSITTVLSENGRPRRQLTRKRLGRRHEQTEALVHLPLPAPNFPFTGFTVHRVHSPARLDFVGHYPANLCPLSPVCNVTNSPCVSHDKAVSRPRFIRLLTG